MLYIATFLVSMLFDGASIRTQSEKTEVMPVNSHRQYKIMGTVDKGVRKVNGAKGSYCSN